MAKLVNGFVTQRGKLEIGCFPIILEYSLIIGLLIEIPKNITIWEY